MYMLYMFLFRTSYRFLQLPELVERLGRLHDSYRSLLKSAERLWKRVEEETMKSAVVEPETYIRDTISSPEAEEYFKNMRPDSFQHIFWQQQVEAASKSKSKFMRWHPLMIRFCLSQAQVSFSCTLEQMF